ncbi:MAG: ABC transporter permease, partial [Actinobacteria bacterium]
MFAYITRRLVYGLVTLLALSMIVFALLQLSGGGPLDRLRQNPRMQDFIEMLTRLWGLDQPVWRQYLTWLKNYVSPQEFSLHNALPFVFLGIGVVATLALIRFMKSQWRGAAILGVWAICIYLIVSNMTFRMNWGISFQGAGDVWNLVFSRVGATFRLGFTALFLALLIGIPLGIYQAIRQYSFFDQLGTTAAFVAFSMPIFIVGIGLQLIFALYLERWTGVKVFYVTGMNDPAYDTMTTVQQIMDTMRPLTLPALAIALI